MYSHLPVLVVLFKVQLMEMLNKAAKVQIKLLLWLHKPWPAWDQIWKQIFKSANQKSTSEQWNGYKFTEVRNVFKTFDTHENLPQNLDWVATFCIGCTIRYL